MDLATILGTLTNVDSVEYDADGKASLLAEMIVAEEWEGGGRVNSFKVNFYGESAEEVAPLLQAGSKAVVMGKVMGGYAEGDASQVTGGIVMNAWKAWPVANELADFQTLTVSGYVGRTPELRYTPDAIQVASFGLGVKVGYNKAEDKDITFWPNIVCWRQSAETAVTWFERGKYLVVTGNMATNPYWSTKYNEARATIDVHMFRFEFGGGGKSSPRSSDQVPAGLGAGQIDDEEPF